MIVHADELEVRQMAVSDRCQKAGDILSVQRVIFKMNLVVPDRSSQHQCRVQRLNSMVLPQSSDMDFHGCIRNGMLWLDSDTGVQVVHPPYA